MRKLSIDKVRLIALFLVLVLVMMCAVGCKSDKKDNKTKSDLEKVILTINDKDYTLQDIMYILYTVESHMAEDINFAVAQGISESEYWNEIDDGTGKTVRELTKEGVLSTAENVILQAQLAKEQGYELTADDLDTVEYEVQEVLESLEGNAEYLNRTGFTKEKLTEMIKQYNLAYKYSMDQMEKMKVDKDTIETDLDPKDYAQVEIEYILFWTGDVDKDGNYALYEPEKISEILKKAQAAYEEVANGADLITVGDKYYSEDYTVEAGNQPLYNNPEENEESLYNAFKDLKVGELYPGVIETSDGYYIIRLVNDNCTDAYDQMIEEETKLAQEDAFETEFNKIKAGYTIKVNEENWANIEIGNYAFPPVDNGSDQEFDIDEDNSEEDSDDSGIDIIDDDGAVG